MGADRGPAGRGGAVHPPRRGDEHPAPAGPRAAAARPHPRPARRYGSLPGGAGRRVRQPHRTRPRAVRHPGRDGPGQALAADAGRAAAGQPGRAAAGLVTAAKQTSRRGCRGSWCTATSGTTTSSSAARTRCSSPTSVSWPNGPASTTSPSRCITPTPSSAWPPARTGSRRCNHWCGPTPGGLGSPLTDAERQALPWAIARQPLWGIGGWVATLDNEHTARAHARATAPAIGRALQLIAGIHAWQTGLS